MLFRSVRLLGHKVVVSSTGAESGGPSPTAATYPLAVRQRVVSEAALRLMSGEDAPLVVELPTTWEGDEATSFFDGLDQSWLRPVSVTSLQARQAKAVSASSLLYPDTEVEAEILGHGARRHLILGIENVDFVHPGPFRHGGELLRLGFCEYASIPVFFGEEGHGPFPVGEHLLFRQLEDPIPKFDMSREIVEPLLRRRVHQVLEVVLTDEKEARSDEEGRAKGDERNAMIEIGPQHDLLDIGWKGISPYLTNKLIFLTKPNMGVE